MTTFDLRSARLRSGEEHRDEQKVELAPLTFAGQRYDAVPELVPAELSVTQATNPGDAEELSTQYVVDDRLELSSWARDATALALPDKILCRPDCAGLCPVCGRDLNREPHAHEEKEPDPRWAALAELREKL